MSLEIEKKYLVIDDSFVAMSLSVTHIEQGYLSTNVDSTVRLRIKDSAAYITIKSRNQGIVRHEWEYPIPVNDAKEMMALCSSKIVKDRYIVEYKGNIWEVDRFLGRLDGLIIAEIELSDPNQEFELPPFVGRDVTNNPYYYNSNLSKIE